MTRERQERGRHPFVDDANSQDVDEFAFARGLRADFRFALASAVDERLVRIDKGAGDVGRAPSPQRLEEIPFVSPAFLFGPTAFSGWLLRPTRLRRGKGEGEYQRRHGDTQIGRAGTRVQLERCPKWAVGGE